MVSRKQEKGVIKDLEWKKTFVSLSLKHDQPIVPIYIQGQLSNFFYRIYKLRTFLGIKANIEMLYLPDEMYKQKGRTIRITFGKPVDSTAFENPSNDREWADKIKNMVYSLSNQSPVNK